MKMRDKGEASLGARPKVLHIHPALAEPEIAADEAPIAPGSSISPADIQRIMQQALDERAAGLRLEAQTHGVDTALWAAGLTLFGYVGAGLVGGLVGAAAGLLRAHHAEPILGSLSAPSTAAVGHDERPRWSLNGVAMGLTELRRRGREAGRKIAVQWLLQERPDLEAIDAMLLAGVPELARNANGEATPYDEALATEARTVILRERGRLVPGERARSAAAEAQEVAARAAAEARRLAEMARNE
jgi:hypothetical protein